MLVNTDRDSVKLFRRCGSDEAVFLSREDVPKQTPDILKLNSTLGGHVMHSLPVEWLPVSIAPCDGDLEVCVLGYDGIVHALEFPYHKDGAEWVDALNKKQVDIQPTHWRKWNGEPLIRKPKLPLS